MGESRWWLVSYDIREPKRLRKAARLVEGHGHRVQYSVYRCWLGVADMERLRWELTRLLPAEDSVLVIPLCDRCVRGITGIHGATRPAEWPEEPTRHAIV